MSTVLEPVELLDKLEQPFRVRELSGEADRAKLERMYTLFLPKRTAQGLPPETEYAIKRWLDRILPNGRHLLVEVIGGVWGHLLLMPMDDSQSLELAIFLHQSIRGRGIGTAMNRFAISFARDNGYKRVWLSVEPSNIAAVRSYQKAGFQTLRHTVWASEIEMEYLITP